MASKKSSIPASTLPATKVAKPFGLMIAETRRDMHARHPMTQKYTNRSAAAPVGSLDNNARYLKS